MVFKIANNDNTFDIWEFRKSKDKIKYIESHEVPLEIYVYDQEWEDDFQQDLYVNTWDLISETWYLSEEFILKYMNELNAKILLENENIRISNSTRVALKLMQSK